MATNLHPMRTKKHKNMAEKTPIWCPKHIDI